MGAITATRTKTTELAGDIVSKIFTVTLGSASDTIDLSSYFDTIYFVTATIEGGLDANLANIVVTWSGTTVTITSVNAAGGASTNWDSANLRLKVEGSQNLNSGS